MHDTLVVVVGAGASYDSQPLLGRTTVKGPTGDIRTWGEVRPPLTVGLISGTYLVNEVLSKHHGAQQVASFLRDEMRTNPSAQTLEQALDHYQSTTTGPYVKRNLNSFRWFLRELLLECGQWTTSPSSTGGITNYTRLVDVLLRWANRTDSRVVFASLNYDTLLEDALQKATHRNFLTDKLASYCDNYRGQSWADHPRRVSLVKPHGSAAWLWDDREDGELTAELDPNPALDRDLFSPHLALPVVDKTRLMWPNEQRDFFHETLESMTMCLSIGWRAADEVFLNILASRPERLRSVHTVGGCSHEDAQGRDPVALRNATAEDATRVFSMAGDTDCPRTSSSWGFSDWLDNRGLHEFLDQ